MPQQAVKPEQLGLIPSTGIQGPIPNSLLGTDVQRSNLLVNGGFEAWQRGNGPFTTLFCSDRWYISSGAGGTLSTTKDTTHQDVASTACAAVVYTAGTSISNFEQQVEIGVGGLRGKPVTFSARVAPGAVGGVRLMVVDSDGTTILGTSPANVGGNNLVYETMSLTVTPAAATGTRLFVRLQFQTGAVGGTYYLDNAMLVLGTVAADFVPLTLADDVTRNLRYYQRWSVLQNVYLPSPGGTQTATTGFNHLAAQLPMVPGISATMTVSAAGHFATVNTSFQGSWPLTALSLSSGNAYGTLLAWTSTTSTQTAGTACWLISVNSAAALSLETNP